MRNTIGVCVLLLGSLQLAWGIYAPSLTRSDAATDLLACQESQFSESQQVVQAMKSGDPEQVLQILGGALTEWRNTRENSALYSARSFCIHEIVPNQLPPRRSNLLPSCEASHSFGSRVQTAWNQLFLLWPACRMEAGQRSSRLEGACDETPRFALGTRSFSDDDADWVEPRRLRRRAGPIPGSDQTC